jgi:hypothetical protein
MAHAALRLGASASEACLDYRAGTEHLRQLCSLVSRQAVPHSSSRAAQQQHPLHDFEALDGFQRSAAAEAALAWARLRLSSAPAGAAGAAGAAQGLSDASSALQGCLSAARSIELELSACEGPAEAHAAAALLPAALAHARASSLLLLVAYLEAQGAEAAAQAAEQHAALAENACSSVEDVTRRCILRQGSSASAGGGAAEPLPPSELLLGGVLLGRAAAVRSCAHQNMAAVRLLAAAAALQEGSAAGSSGQQAAAALALSLLTAAQGQLQLSLSAVQEELRRRELQEASSASAGSASASATASSRLRWDLLSARCELTAALGELQLLTALATVWLPVVAPAGAAGGAAAQAAASSSTTHLFPLSEQDASVIEPVVAAAWKLAHESLKDAELLEAAAAGSALALSDRGPDYGLGAARPLRLLALLHFVEAKAVTAEGLFRGALDKFAALPVAGGSGGGSGGGAAGSSSLLDAAQRWQALPLPCSAQAGSTLHAYAALLGQWEKREGEAAQLSSAAQALLQGAAAAWRLQRPAPVHSSAGPGPGSSSSSSSSPGPGSSSSSSSRDFLASRLLAAALTTAHIGSWGLGLPQDLAEL